MKRELTVLTLLSILTFSQVTRADEILLPVISKPSTLEEGTQRTLTAAQIAELLPWAKDSKLFLTDLLDNIQGLTSQDKIDRLAEGIATVVGDSAPKNSELLMRYSLNRGLVLYQILSQEMDAEAVGTTDAKIRVLKSSIEMALKYYITDMEILSKKTVAPFVIFGMDYFEFLNELNKSVFDASAQYSIQRTALEWLQWDLYRDLNNASYAPQIVKINNALKTFSNKKITDAQAIANIRLMKKTAEQLNVKTTLAKLEEEMRLASAKTDEERRLMLAKTAEEKNRIQREAELERKRAFRSAVENEKIKSYALTLSSYDWTIRRESARQLAGIVGGDITQLLLQRFVIEGDTDVAAALFSALVPRMGKIQYILKNESIDVVNANLVQIAAAGRPSDWSRRRQTVILLDKVETLESYRLLGIWMNAEKDSDVMAQIRRSMATLEVTLK